MSIHEYIARKRKRQSGLASVEAVLIMPILLWLMYIMVHSAKTMVMFEQRSVEARNAAYAVELYNGGKPILLDELRQTADEAAQGVEDQLIQTINTLGSYGVHVGDHVQSDHLAILQKFPIQRYATVSENSDWFYKQMLTTAIDEQDSAYPDDDPDILGKDGLRGLYSMLDHQESKSGITVGVSVSAYTGPLGLFTPFNGHFFMRNHHAADFAKTLNLNDIEINNQEVITAGYNLKAGYSKEMKAMLNPTEIFTNLFADTSTQALPIADLINLPLPPPTDPTILGIQDPAALEEQQYQDYRASGGRKSKDNWRRAGRPANLFVQQLDLSKSRARQILDDNLGGVRDDDLDAHHIIPLKAIADYRELMELAAKGGFNINGADAGILLGPTEHVGNHPIYSARVLADLGRISVTQTPARAAAQLRRVVNKWRNNITTGVDGPWH